MTACEQNNYLQESPQQATFAFQPIKDSGIVCAMRRKRKMKIYGQDN